MFSQTFDGHFLDINIVNYDTFLVQHNEMEIQ